MRLELSNSWAGLGVDVGGAVELEEDLRDEEELERIGEAVGGVAVDVVVVVVVVGVVVVAGGCIGVVSLLNDMIVFKTRSRLCSTGDGG